MMKASIVVMLVTLFGAAPSPARNVVISDIEDGGIYCKTFDKDIDRFYKVARKRCRHKISCVVRATMVATRRDLLQHHCSGFFVAPICNGEPVNVETHQLFKPL